MADKTVRGRFVWHELMTSDPKAAAAFYKEVVGWVPQPYEKDPSYTVFTNGGRPRAGSMLLPEQAKAMGAAPHWLTHIGTPDVDVTARQTIELGGKVLKPAADIHDVGRFAVLQDPQGAVFAVFTPKPGPAGDTKPGLGDFSWHELVTTDWKSAWNFYQKLFGWEKTESMEMGPGNTYQMFGWKGNTLGGMFNKPAEMPFPPHWLPYTLVPDSKKVAEIAPRFGGKVLNGPMEVPGGDWITQAMDPQGVLFAVHSKKAAAAAAPAAKRRTAPPRKSKPAKRKSVAAKKSKPAKKKTARPKPRKASKRRR
jgi:predicted enzyme related to lactoylglutathione lyase